MAEGSFAEWRAACLACDQRAASPDYPSVTALAAVAPPGFDADVPDFSLQPRFDISRAFLQHLRRICAPDRKSFFLGKFFSVLFSLGFFRFFLKIFFFFFF